MSELFVLPKADVGAGLTPSDGSKLFFSETGLSFDANPKATYSDITAATSHANPVLADGRGVFPAIYLTGTYRAVLKDKNDVQIWVIDNINSQGFGNNAWVLSTSTPTQTGAAVFTVTGDKTSEFQVGRRFKGDDTTTLFGTIITSVFTSLTTVTVRLDTGVLSGSLTAVHVGLTSTEMEVGTATVAHTDPTQINQIIYGLERIINDLPKSVRLWGANETNTAAVNNTAIQNAIDSLVAGTGGILYFPGFGAYKFTNLSIVTDGSFGIRMIGETRRYSRLDCHATSGTAITIGESITSNSGFCSLEHLHIFGTNSTGEVAGVEIFRPGRHCRLDEVTIDSFVRGRGLEANTAILNSWGAVYILACYQACELLGQNASDIQNLVVENCGPTTAYTHSTILATDPSVLLFGQAFNIGTLSIESNDAATNLKLQGAVTVGTYYSESNTFSDTGNEIAFTGIGGLVKHGVIQNGNAPSAPQLRYMIGFGDAVYAKVERLTYLDPSTDAGNTMFGVDFGTSDLCEANIYFEGFEALSQQAARQQTMLATSKRYKFNGVDYIGRLPVETIGRILFEDFAEIPIINMLMTRPGSSLVANGYVVTGTSAAAILTKEKSFYIGEGRVQKVIRSGAGTAVCQITISAGTLNPTSKYFFSSFIYATDWSASKPLARVVNGATNQGILVNDGNLTGGWIRHSEILVLPNATTSDVIWRPCEIGSATDPAWVTFSHIIDLTAFDAAFGTALALMPTFEIEKILDPAIFQDLYHEWSRNTAPVDGTYEVGDKVQYHPATAGSNVGAVCTVAGTPGTWKDYGVIDA